jgi:hypothetical protein
MTVNPKGVEGNQKYYRQFDNTSGKYSERDILGGRGEDIPECGDADTGAVDQTKIPQHLNLHFD